MQEITRRANYARIPTMAHLNMDTSFKGGQDDEVLKKQENTEKKRLVQV